MSPQLRYTIPLLALFSLLWILPTLFLPAPAAGQTMFEMGLVGEWSNYGNFHSVEVWRQEEARDGGDVWVTYAGCATSKGLVIVDFHRHAVSSFLPIGECLDLATKGDAAGGDTHYLYVAQGETGLCCINVTNPSHPYSIALTDTPGTARGVAIAGDCAFVADSDAGLQIIDIGNPARLENIGSCDTPGTARGVTVAGNHAFVADGDCGLQIIDIANRSGPHIVGTCDTSGTAKGVAVAGDYALVADDEYGIQVIDIADKNLPVGIGTCDTPGKARAVSVCGAFACIADEKGGLLIIDVSSPHIPEIVGGCITPQGAYDIAMLDDCAYVAGGNYSIQVIDIRDKRGPRITGTCAIGTTALDVAVSGDYAYVAYVQHEPTKRSGLKIVNITDSAGPEVVGTFEAEETEVHGLCVVNELVYLAYGDGHLDIIDATLKDAPELLGTCTTRIDSYHVFVEEGYAYVTNWQEGIEIIDVSDPNSPHVTGSCSTPGKAYGIAVSEDYAYVADEINGLQVINVADSALPVLAGRYVTSGGAIDVTILGNCAFVVDSSGDLQIIDVSDPQHLEIIGHHQIHGDAVDIAVASGYAYIADGVDGVRVFDVSDANAPVPMGTCSTPGSAQALAIEGDYAYAVDWEGDLYIIDMQEKGGPAWKEGHGTSSLCAYDVSIAGDYAFVSDWKKGMRVIRISDHNGLELVGSCDTPGYALGLDTAGEYAYVADWECGLQIIDVIDKARPVIEGRCPTPGYAWDVAVSGNYAFVTDGDLQIIDMSDTRNPQIVSTCDTIMGRFVTVAGNYAYVANTYMEGEEKKSVIQIIDVENRFDPDIMASYDTYGYAKDLAVSGDFLYVANGYKGLRIVNVQDKRHPHLQGRCDIPGNAEGIRIVGDYAFISYCKDEGEPEERVSGIAVVDITNPSTPVIVGTYETQGHAYDVAVSGSYVYVADWEYGLLKLSIDMAPFPRGNLILVAGGGANPDNVLWPATQAQANGIFQAFIRNGYDCHDIWYQNPVSFQDTDLDGVVNQLVVDDATPTKDEFIDLFTDWATTSASMGPLYIWLIGHGAEDRFQIMPDEVITAGELKACIDQFHNATDRQVVVIIESGASGTLIDDLAGEGVTVIASAGDGPSSIKPNFLDPNIPHGVPAPSEGRIKAYRSFTTALIEEMGICLAQPSTTPEALISAVKGAFLRSRDVMKAWTLEGLPFSDQAPQMATPEASLASLSFSEDGKTPLDALMIAQDAPVYLTVIGRGMDGAYAPLLTPVTLFSSDPNILDPSDPETISTYTDSQGVPWYEVKPTGNGNLSIIGHGSANAGANLLSAVLSIEVFVDDPDYLSRKGKRAIIIAGYRGTGDYLWESTNTIANHAFRTLRAMGYGKHEISYYSPFLLQDLDGQGGYDDICGYPHLDVLNPDSPSSPLASIKQSGAEELLLFLIDHGDQGAFCLNPAETLSSEQLIEWMTGIADRVEEGITLIYDACYSGGFLRDIEQSGAPLAEKLVTITSTDPNQTAYYLNNGMVSFSYPFFDEWFLTRSLMDAFDYASRFLPREGQTPLCSDPNIILLRDQGRIYFVDESRPVITDPLISRTEGTLEVSARVYSLTGISQVWAIAESSRQEPAHAWGEAVTEAPELTLVLDSDPNYPFGGEYRLRIQDPCPHEPHYNLTIYAQDKGERPRVASRKIAVGSTMENNTIALILASTPSLFPPDEGERLSDQADRAEAVLRNRLLGQEDIQRIAHLDDLVIPPLAEGQTLFLYLVGMVRSLEEGIFFYLNPNERISPQGLESLLDPNQRLLILMDAPYSCQFLSRINWEATTNWAGIASTPFDRLMFSIGENHTPFPCFSTFFFSGILSGATVAQSLRMAQNAVSLTRQMPGIFLPGDLPLDYRTINRHLGYYLGMAAITGEGGTLIRGCSARAEEGSYILGLDAQADAHVHKAWVILVSPAVFYQGSTIVDLEPVDGANQRYEATLLAGAPYYNAFFMAEGRTEGYTEDWIEWEMVPFTGVAGVFDDDPLEPDEPPEEILLDPDHTLVVNAHPIRRTFYCTEGGNECEDIDWIQFYGRAGHTYEIYAQDLSEFGYFIRLGLHDLELNPVYDLGRPLVANNYLAFACPTDGYYLLRAQLAAPYPSVGVEYIVSVMVPKAQEVTSLLVRVKCPEMKAYCARGMVDPTGECISPTIRRYVYPDTIAFKFNNVIQEHYITVLVYEGNIPGGNPVAEVTVYLVERLLNEVTIDLTDLPPDRNLTAFGIGKTEYQEVIGNYIIQGLPAVQRGDMDPNFLPEGDYDGDAIPNCDEVLLYGTTPCSPTIPLVLRQGINPFYFPSVEGVLNMPGLQAAFHVFYYAPLAGIWEEEAYGMAHSNAFNALEVPQPGTLFLELNDPSCPVVYLRGFVSQGYTPQAPSAKDFIDTHLFDPSHLLQNATTTDMLRKPEFRDIDTINCHDSRKGSWSTTYRFFGRVSGKRSPLDPYEVLIINRGDR